MSRVRLALIRSDKLPIAKKVERRQNGSLAITADADLVSGIAQNIDATPQEIVDLIVTADHKDCFSFTPFIYERVYVKHDKFIAGYREKGQRPVHQGVPIVSRTLQYMRRPAGVPSIFHGDLDVKTGDERLRAETALKRLVDVVPGLASALIIIRDSSSSFIFDEETGEQLIGEGSQHFYIPLLDGGDIERMNDVLQDRLTLAGFGHACVSSSGSISYRTMLDKSVNNAGRLVFIAPAQCGPGLVQRAREPVIINPYAPFFDSRSHLPDLTAQEKLAVTQIREALRAEVQPEADRVREGWLGAQVEKQLRSIPKNAPERTERANKIRSELERSLETGDLYGDHEIELKIGGAIISVPVKEVVKNFSRYKGALGRDPLDPSYQHGKIVSKVLGSARRPVIVSMASGQRNYLLHAELKDESAEPPPGPAPTKPKRTAKAVDTPVGIWGAAVDPAGTPGDTLLAHFNAESLGLARWLKNRSALVFPLTDDDGALHAVSLLAVTANGEIDRQRWVRGGLLIGKPGAGALRIKRDSAGSCICLTPAEALACYAAGYDAIALGMSTFVIDCLLRHTEPGHAYALMFRDTQQNQQFEAVEAGYGRLVSSLLATGRNVQDIRPYDTLRGTGDGVVDRFMTHGARSFGYWLDCFLGATRIVDLEIYTVAEARKAKAGYIAPTSVELIKRGYGVRIAGFDAGGGKTTTMRNGLEEIVEASREASTKSGGDTGLSVYLTAPIHAIHDETISKRSEIEDAASLDAAASELAGDGVTVAPIRGRNAYAPLSTTETMCQNLQAIERAEADGVPDLSSAVCKRCPKAKGCAYLNQTRVADVLLTSHVRMTADITGDVPRPSLIIVDESPISAFLKPSQFLPLRFIEDEAMPVSPKQPNRHADLRQRLIHAAEINGLGYLKLESLEGVGLADVETLSDFRRFEIERQIKPGKDGKTSVCRPNKSIDRMRDLLWAAREMVRSRVHATGRIEIADVKTKAGVCRGFLIRTPHRLGKGWDAPTLIMAALPDIRLLRHIFGPHVTHGPTYRLAMPHARIYQTIGRSFAKTSLARSAMVSKDEAAEASADRSRARLRDDVLTFAASVRRALGGKQFIASNKGAIEGMDLTGRPYVLTGWFNALIGLNNFEQCRSGLIVGRGAIPAPRAVEDAAMALSGRVIQRVGAQWPRRYEKQLVRLPDGRHAEILRLSIYHPDETADALLKFFGAYQVYQAAYRLRPANRTADDPATIFVLNDLVLPFPIDGYIPATEITDPSNRARALSVDGVTFASGSAAFAFGRHIGSSHFDSERTAQRAVVEDSARFGTVAEFKVTLNPDSRANSAELNTSFGGNGARTQKQCHLNLDFFDERGSVGPLPVLTIPETTAGLRRFSFRKTGSGNEAQYGLFDPIIRPNFRAELDAAFAPIAEIWIEAEATPATPTKPDHKPNLSKTRPWEAEGVSRKTWFRRRKTAAQTTTTEEPAMAKQPWTTSHVCEVVIDPFVTTRADMPETEQKPTRFFRPGARSSLSKCFGLARDPCSPL